VFDYSDAKSDELLWRKFSVYFFDELLKVWVKVQLFSFITTSRRYNHLATLFFVVLVVLVFLVGDYGDSAITCISVLLMLLLLLHYFSFTITRRQCAFSVLTMLVGRQEEYPACKNWVMVICLERGAECLHMVQLMPLPYPNHLLPHLNPDWFYLSGTG